MPDESNDDESVAVNAESTREEVPNDLMGFIWSTQLGIILNHVSLYLC